MLCKQNSMYCEKHEKIINKKININDVDNLKVYDVNKYINFNE